MSLTSVSVGSFAFEAAVVAGADAQLMYSKPSRWLGDPADVDLTPREVKLLRFEDGRDNVLAIDKAADEPRKFRLSRIVDVRVPSEFADIPADEGNIPAVSGGEPADSLLETLCGLSGSDVTITADDDDVTVTWRVQDSGAALHAPGRSLTEALTAALDLERSLRS